MRGTRRKEKIVDEPIGFEVNAETARVLTDRAVVTVETDEVTFMIGEKERRLVAEMFGPETLARYDEVQPVTFHIVFGLANQQTFDVYLRKWEAYELLVKLASYLSREGEQK